MLSHHRVLRCAHVRAAAWSSVVRCYAASLGLYPQSSYRDMSGDRPVAATTGKSKPAVPPHKRAAVGSGESPDQEFRDCQEYVSLPRVIDLLKDIRKHAVQQNSRTLLRIGLLENTYSGIDW